MKKDIPDNTVSGVTIAIAKKVEDGEEQWHAYLLNQNEFEIDNVLITSKGYGKKDGEEVKTSVTRQMIEQVAPNSATVIEPIDPALFVLNNEYWVSYYIKRDIYDKKFVFLSDSITEEHMIPLSMLEGLEGVLHY